MSHIELREYLGVAHINIVEPAPNFCIDCGEKVVTTSDLLDVLTPVRCHHCTDVYLIMREAAPAVFEEVYGQEA